VLSDAPSCLGDAVSLGARTHIISLYDYVIKSVSLARLDTAGVVRDTFLSRVSLRLGCNSKSCFLYDYAISTAFALSLFSGVVSEMGCLWKYNPTSTVCMIM